MMVPKTHRDPESETLVTFAFASLGGALAAGAVGVIDVSLLLYPAYYCIVNGAIALLIHQRRRALRRIETLTFDCPRRRVTPRIPLARDDWAATAETASGVPASVVVLKDA